VYIISQGNRGYIFLVSIMKAVFFTLTAGLCLQLCGNMLSSAIITGVCAVPKGCRDEPPAKNCNMKEFLGGRPAFCGFSGGKNNNTEPDNFIIWLIYSACLVPFILAAMYTFYTKRGYGTMRFNSLTLLVTLMAEGAILVVMLIVCLAD
jgi:hypothetical protein